jgi:hypothetical protein
MLIMGLNKLNQMAENIILMHRPIMESYIFVKY